MFFKNLFIVTSFVSFMSLLPSGYGQPPFDPRFGCPQPASLQGYPQPRIPQQMLPPQFSQQPYGPPFFLQQGYPQQMQPLPSQVMYSQFPPQPPVRFVPVGFFVPLIGMQTQQGHAISTNIEEEYDEDEDENQGIKDELKKLKELFEVQQEELELQRQTVQAIQLAEQMRLEKEQEAAGKTRQEQLQQQEAQEKQQQEERKQQQIKKEQEQIAHEKAEQERLTKEEAVRIQKAKDEAEKIRQQQLQQQKAEQLRKEEAAEKRRQQQLQQQEAAEKRKQTQLQQQELQRHQELLRKKQEAETKRKEEEKRRKDFLKKEQDRLKKEQERAAQLLKQQEQLFKEQQAQEEAEREAALKEFQEKKQKERQDRAKRREDQRQQLRQQEGNAGQEVPLESMDFIDSNNKFNRKQFTALAGLLTESKEWLPLIEKSLVRFLQSDVKNQEEIVACIFKHKMQAVKNLNVIVDAIKLDTAQYKHSESLNFILTAMLSCRFFTSIKEEVKKRDIKSLDFDGQVINTLAEECAIAVAGSERALLIVQGDTEKFKIFFNCYIEFVKRLIQYRSMLPFERPFYLARITQLNEINKAVLTKGIFSEQYLAFLQTKVQETSSLFNSLGLLDGKRDEGQA